MRKCNGNGKMKSKILLQFKNIFLLFSEFCDHVNENVDTSLEEKPKFDTVDYVLEPAPPAPAEDEKDDVAEAKAAIKASTKGGLIIFAIDISGSMNCTVEVPDLQGKGIANSFLPFPAVLT